MNCHSPEFLAAYQEGGLDPLEREALEGHAADCNRCQEALLLLGLRQEPSHSRAWGWAAAAGLLVAATLAFLPGKPRDGSLEVPSVPVKSEASGLDLLLEPGARISGSGRKLRAEAGRLWLRGDAVLEVSGVRLALRDAEVAVRVAPPGETSWLLSEALAGEAALAEIWALHGEVEASAGGRMLILRPGRKLVLGGEWRDQEAGREELAALEMARAQAAAMLPGVEMAVPGLRLSGEDLSVGEGVGMPGFYRWVTVLKGRPVSAELGFTLPAGGRWHRWVAGLAALPPQPEEVVEIVWDGRGLTARVNGAVRLSVDGEHLGEALRPAGRAGWGISAWGAPVVVSGCRLQEGRAP